MELPFEKQFHFRDGSAISSVEQLRERLETLNYNEFYHHVNQERNDFANWIRHVLDQPQLADDLQKVTSIVETVEVLNDYVHPHPSGQDMQSRIEESVGIRPPMAPVEQDAWQTHAAELPTWDDAPQRIVPEERPDFTTLAKEVDAHPGLTDARPGKVLMDAHDRKMLIVKDFLLGFLFGLIVGMILGRII